MKTDLVRDIVVSLNESNNEEANRWLNKIDGQLASLSLQDLTCILAELRRYPTRHQEYRKTICLEVLSRWEWASSTDLKSDANSFSSEYLDNKRLLVESISELIIEELSFPDPNLDRLTLMACGAAKQKHFAKLGKERESALYVKLINQIMQDFKSLEPRQLARLASAAARRPHRQHEILIQIHKAVLSCLHSCDVHSLIALAYAFSFHKIGDELFFQQASIKISKTLPTLKPYFIALAAYAYAREDIDSSNVFKVAVETFRVRADEFGHNELSRLARSFELANHGDPLDLRLLAQCVAFRLVEFRNATRRELRNSLSAFSEPLGNYGDALEVLFTSEELEAFVSGNEENLDYQEVAAQLTCHSRKISLTRTLQLLRAMKTLGLLEEIKYSSQTNWQKLYSTETAPGLNLAEQAELLSYFNCNDPECWKAIFQEATLSPQKNLDTEYQILSFAPRVVVKTLTALNTMEQKPLDYLTPRQWALELWFYMRASQHDKDRSEKLIERIFFHLDWFDTDSFLIVIWACKNEILCDENLLVKTAIEIESRIGDFDFHELLILGQFLTQEGIHLETLASRVAIRAARCAQREHSAAVRSALKRINSTSKSRLSFLDELLWEKVRNAASHSKRHSRAQINEHHIAIIRKFHKLAHDNILVANKKSATEFKDIANTICRNWYRMGRSLPLNFVAEYAQLIPLCSKLDGPRILLTFAQDVGNTFQSQLDSSHPDTLAQLFPKLDREMFKLRALRELLFRCLLKALKDTSFNNIKKYLDYFAPLSEVEISQFHEELSNTLLIAEISTWDSNLREALRSTPDPSGLLEKVETQLLLSLDRLPAFSMNKSIELSKSPALKEIIERLHLRFSTNSFTAKKHELANLFLLFKFSLPPLLVAETLQDIETSATTKLKILKSESLDRLSFDRYLLEIINWADASLVTDEKIKLTSFICELIDLFENKELPERVLNLILNSLDRLHIRAKVRVLATLNQKGVVSKEPYQKLTKQILNAFYNCAHGTEEVFREISDRVFLSAAEILIEDVLTRARSGIIESEEIVAGVALFKECSYRRNYMRLSGLPNERIVLDLISQSTVRMSVEDLSYVLEYLVAGGKTIRSATTVIRGTLTLAALSELEPETVAALAKSLSDGDFLDKKIFLRIEKSICKRYSDYPKPLLVDTLQSFERSNILPQSLLTIAINEIVDPETIWDKDALSEFCVVLARLNRMPRSIAMMVEIALSQEDEILTLEQTAKFAWSLAICAPAILEKVWTNALALSQPKTLEPVYLRFLHQISIACDLPIPEPLKKQCLLAVEQASRFIPGASRFEYQVAKTLNAVGCNFHEQYPLDGFRIDFVAHGRRKKWAIECNGSRFHYVNGDKKYGLRGEDILKSKILRKRGYQVIQITDTTWRRLRNREAWLLCQLRRG